MLKFPRAEPVEMQVGFYLGCLQTPGTDLFKRNAKLESHFSEQVLLPVQVSYSA
jgi:hypothetical protein